MLTGYDLPDLIGCIAPRKVVLADLKNQLLEQASSDLVEMDMAFPRLVYSNKKADGNLKIISSCENSSSLVDWCFK